MSFFVRWFKKQQIDNILRILECKKNEICGEKWMIFPVEILKLSEILVELEMNLLRMFLNEAIIFVDFLVSFGQKNAFGVKLLLRIFELSGNLTDFFESNDLEEYCDLLAVKLSQVTIKCPEILSKLLRD